MMAPVILKDRFVDRVWKPVKEWNGRHLNFYRVHMIFFTITPLVASAIFWASNKEDDPIPFIECLFMCTSAMTVTGLNCTLLQRMTIWQQVIIFLLMCAGSLTSVSLITILVRRNFFRAKFERMVQTDPGARRRVEAIEAAQIKAEGRSHRFLHPKRLLHSRYPTSDIEDETEGHSRSPEQTAMSSPAQSISEKKRRRDRAKRKLKGFTTDMISRVEQPGQVQRIIDNLATEKETVDAENLALASAAQSQVNLPAAAVDADEKAEPKVPEPSSPRRGSVTMYNGPIKRGSVGSAGSDPRLYASPTELSQASRPEVIESSDEDDEFDVTPRRRRFSESLPRTTQKSDLQFKRVRTLADPTRAAEMLDEAHEKPFQRTVTIEFAKNNSDNISHDHQVDPPDLRRRAVTGERRRRRSTATNEFGRTKSMRSAVMPPSTRNDGFGGFPNPVSIVASLAQNAVGSMHRTLTMQPTNTQSVNNFKRHETFKRQNTFQRTGTIASTRDFNDPKPVPYISFDAIVGRNSRFRSLTSAQEEELGGVEYRALSVLWKIVAGYWLGFQLIAVLLAAPYLRRAEFREIFEVGGQGTNTTWYTFFNVWSAFSNNGMSLLDASMTPFNATYYWILTLMVLILAGNTGYPIFLRLIIWILCKLSPKDSRFRETTQFLLDHPRRCFLYLFPSYQTWFLLFVLFVLNTTDWAAFLILDIGNEVLEQIPLNVRVIDGLFQAFAVRAAGFGIVNVADTAPALQVLYVIMMYIAVYPIALSIRSTNVYEERSMGIFEESEDESDVEAEFVKKPNAGGYIAYHARKQLAFDLWWLVLALFTICIIERGEIENNATDSWFNVFTIIFEITSAYGTVGLSLGSPVTGTSLSGSFRTLSKLILCAVMIRGRHRGLPIAIDRAVLLPTDMTKLETRTDTNRSIRTRRSSAGWDEEMPPTMEPTELEATSPSSPTFQNGTLRFSETTRPRATSKDAEGLQLSDLSGKTETSSDSKEKEA